MCVHVMSIRVCRYIAVPSYIHCYSNSHPFIPLINSRFYSPDGQFAIGAILSVSMSYLLSCLSSDP